MLSLTLLALAALAAPPHPARPPPALRDADLQAFLDRDNGECGPKRPVHIDHLEFADLDGDGAEEALLVASTCMTGTAGPDIHEVYRAGPDGKPQRLPIQETRETAHARIAGNANYTLRAEGGLLVREYTDSSERKRPWTEYFRWEHDAFRLVRIEKAPTYPTSFDCERARTSAEITICGNPKLAALDRALADAFEKARGRASGAARDALVEQQRAWVAERDQRCVYKMIVECVRERYERRLKELGAPVKPAR